ncbi:hypothetical protein AAV94_13285 [Lampropedia cohaerens]|uniref:Signal transduction histidine kinase n=1 Tax=Lampropedia cohaerens TaxID=1610491 RepID=A0A0U1PX55_9BURK|nr:hypothetical protein [Lampropedia cohaerens]KKW67017.1 hypothetical protein AAV94_13285 [Lampropedia cohaerens]
MNARLILITLLAIAIGGLYYFNWDALNTPATTSLGIASIDAPPGLVLLVLLAALAILFVAYILWLKATIIVDYHRHTKELKRQRELAEKAEASRFNELRELLTQQHRESQDTLRRQIEELEDHLYARVDDSDNTTAAYIGQIEDQLRRAPAPQLAHNAEPDQGSPDSGPIR